MANQVGSAYKVMQSQTPLPRRQLGLNFSTLALIYGPTLLLFALTSWATFQADLSISFFSRDPTATLKGHPLTGMQSTLGVLVWWAAAGICFFSCLVLQRSQGNTKLFSCLLWSGVIVSVLALDDMFLIHKDLARRYLSLNVKYVFLAYGLLVVWYVIKFRRNIFDSEYFLLFLAFALLGSSILVDFFQNKWLSPARILFEDGAKLLGIVTWSAYLIRTCFHALAPINRGPELQASTLNRAEAKDLRPIKTPVTRDRESRLGVPSA